MNIYQDPTPDVDGIAAFINQQEMPNRLFIAAEAMDPSNPKSKNRFTFSEGKVPSDRPKVKVDKIDTANQGDSILGIVCVSNVNIATGTVHVAAYRELNGSMPNAPATSLSWDNVAQRKEWSAQLLNSVKTYMGQLEQGNPDAFITGYSNLSPQLKLKFWAELLVAVAKFESSWHPTDRYLEVSGEYSVGLLQLSYSDQRAYNLEPLSEAAKSLEDPLVNLRCGVTIFAKLVAQDGIVATSTNGRYRGATKYWSTLRAGHKVDQIIALTKQNVPV